MTNYSDRRNWIERGNMIVGVLIFIFVMIGYVALCFRGTLQEAKLSVIFIQETQSGYALENLLNIGRDYVRNLICNPYQPSILFSPSSLRTYKTAGIIDFSTFFQNNQVVPDGYPLSITAASIDGGPIFFEEKNRDANDKRYFSELFLRANLSISSPFVPNWTARGAQLIELERNPLSDFLIFSEGDTSVLPQYHFWFKGKVHINGNLRVAPTSGMLNSFERQTNVAGHIMRIRTNPYSSMPLPNEDIANGRGGVASTGIALEPGRSGDASYNSSDAYSPDRSTSGVVHFRITNSGTTDYSSGDYTSNVLGKSFENISFERWKLGLMTRYNQLRPLGFDSTMYDGYWHNGLESGAKKNHKILELACGPYSLINARNKNAAKLWGVNQSNTITAFSELRGLSSQQALEKLKLVESQKITNQPGLIVRLYVNDKKSFGYKESFPYAPNWPHLIDITATMDKYAMWCYEDIIMRNKSLVDGFLLYQQSPSNTFRTTSNVDVENDIFRLSVSGQNKLLFETISNVYSWDSSPTNDGLAHPAWRSVVKPKTEATTNTNPDSMFTYLTGQWSFNYTYPSVTNQITQSSHYKFIYDKNRRKWVQLIDFDVSKLLERIADGTIWLSYLAGHVHFCLNDGDWIGSENFYDKLETNHKAYDSDTEDIRDNYFDKRLAFFAVPEYLSGEFNNTKPTPTGIGIRIINAEKLPTGGLTISSTLPLYIQGNFNTVDEQKCSGIYADSITILSNDWKDNESALALNSSLKTSVTANVTINANIMSGSTNPVYWPKRQNNVSRIPEAGIFGILRTLENLPIVAQDSERTTIKGSILSPFRSKIQWEPFIALNSSVSSDIQYTTHIVRPNLTFDYDTTLKVNKLGVSKGMPYYMLVNRGRKTHMLGEITNNTLTSIINIDWDNASNTFSGYKSMLPNYLK